MPTPSLSPKKQAEIDDLERAIGQAVEAEIGELAAEPKPPRYSSTLQECGR